MQEIIEYQNIHAKLRKLESELRSSKNRKSAGEMQQYLKDSSAKLYKLEGLAKTVSEQYNQATKLYNEFITKLENLEKQVQASDEKEAEAVISALNKLAQSGENLDNHIAALQNKIITINKEVETLMNNAKKARRNLEIYKASYNGEREKLEPEINKLKAELEAAKKKVKPEILSKYNQKVESNLFPVYIKALDNKCGYCRMEIPAGKLATLKDKKVIECESCNRLIYID